MSTNETNVIPTNSSTYLIKENYSRFNSALWYNKIKDKKVVLAGVGGIGSYVSFLLSRLGIKELFLYDHDRVELSNLSGQLYTKQQIGKLKVEASKELAEGFSDYHTVYAIAEHYTEESMTSDIMICGFDNMAARKVFFENWLEHVSKKETLEEKKQCLFIDGRLAAEEFQVFAIQGDDERCIRLYEEKWLFTDLEALSTLCSYKQTTYMANMIASTMVNIFINSISNQCGPLIDRDVPFYTTYNAETMYFKTKS